MSVVVKGETYLVGTHRCSFRAGTPAKILRVLSVQPNGTKPDVRAAYEVEFQDGVIDYVAVSDSAHYKILTKYEVEETNCKGLVTQ